MMAGRVKARGRDKAHRPDLWVHFTKRVFDNWPLNNGERVCLGTDYDSGYDCHIRN